MIELHKAGVDLFNKIQELEASMIKNESDHDKMIIDIDNLYKLKASYVRVLMEIIERL